MAFQLFARRRSAQERSGALQEAAEAQERETHPSGLAPGLTWRSFLIAVVLTILCGIWVRQAEIVVVATQITESVPPIPALAVLLILVALNPLLRFLGKRLALTRAELLAIYCFVAIGIALSGCGVIRFWLALITAPFYFDTPENRFASLHHWIPGWLAVKDKSLIRDLYEGTRTGFVPWRAWMVPLLSWTGFFMAMWFSMLCMMVLVRQRWADSERLAFPIAELPIEITSTAAIKGEAPFLKNRLMWLGFGLATLYNLLNILNALYPSVPCPGKFFNLDPALTARPWSSLAPLQLHYRPELVGFGFLVPSEICFSIWFFFLVGRIEALLATLLAWDFPGMPYDQEQSIGAFLLLGAWFLWQTRLDIVRPFRRLLMPGRGRPGNPEPPLWAVAGLFIGFAFLCWFCIKAGMAPWVTIAYLGIVLLTALVCARIRAEAGVPIIWLFPFYQQKKLLLYSLGTSPFLVGGVPATLTIFAMLTFLSRGYFPSLIGSEIESLKIADEGRMSRPRMWLLILLAALVGLGVAYYFHLSPYYYYGAQYLRDGIWGWGMAVQEYRDVIAAQSTPQPRDAFRTGASLFGAVVTFILLMFRRAFVGFPLHPLGYAVATAYGTLVWWSFFLVWLLKVILLKWGGMKLYRRVIPFFLGFALGHFFAAGMIWGILGAIWKDASRAYGVWFG